MTKWRLIDTGLLSAAENMAWDQALLQAQADGEQAPILRFLRFSPSCVLVGRHQSPSQEVRTGYVLSQGWDINRRITGGGTIFFDPSQIGWELFATFDEPWASKGFEKLYRTISQGAIAGLRNLGIEAQFRLRNDIEIDGRKISGTGGASEGNAFMFQGTLLIENAADEMLRALRVPAEKLGRHGLESIRERVAFLDEYISPLPSPEEIKSAIAQGFSETFDVEIVPSQPSERELALFSELLPMMRSDKWIYKIEHPESAKGTLVGLSRKKGILRAAVQVDSQMKRISAVQFFGDFFIEPARALYDLEALLKHQPAKPHKMKEIIEVFFAEKKPHLIGLTAENFSEAIEMALAKLPLIKQGFSFDEANRLFFVNIDTHNWQKIPFSHFQFPYCAKLVGCEFRHKNDCPICSECTVGKGIEIAKKFSLDSNTITSYEKLKHTHRQLKLSGSAGYIGSCCEEFFIKHFETFMKSGLAILLIKLNSATCYDLSQAKAAYRGKFESQTELDLELIEKLLAKHSK